MQKQGGMANTLVKSDPGTRGPYTGPRSRHQTGERRYYYE